MYRLNLSFRPADQESSLGQEHITARGLHGMFFAVLDCWDSSEATWLHEHSAPSPFTIIPIYRQRTLRGMRVNVFTERAVAFILRAWEEARDQTRLLHLGRQRFYAAAVSYQAGLDFIELARECRPATSMHLRFLTPTAFKQGPGTLPLPIPAMIFSGESGPLRAWNAYAPPVLAISDRWVEWCARQVFLVEHDIRTMSLIITRDERGTVDFTGFVGDVWLKTLGGSDEQLARWQALGHVSGYSGVGNKASMGMGAVEFPGQSRQYVTAQKPADL